MCDYVGLFVRVRIVSLQDGMVCNLTTFFNN